MSGKRKQMAESGGEDAQATPALAAETPPPGIAMAGPDAGGQPVSENIATPPVEDAPQPPPAPQPAPCPLRHSGARAGAASLSPVSSAA